MESPYRIARERVAVGDVEISVTDWGGKAAGIVFAHPTGFLGEIWRPIIVRLRERGLRSRIVTIDQRGHGRSSKPDTGYEWSNFVSDTCEILARFDLRGFLGVGHSFGGTILAAAAVRMPNAFRRLALIDPIFIDTEREAHESGVQNPMAARTRTRRLVWSSREEMYQSFRNRRPYDAWTDEALQNYVDEGTFERPDGEIELWCPGRIEAQVYERSGGFDAYAELAKVRVPVLFVRGAQSDSFGVHRSARAMETAANGRIVVLDAVGHYVPMEAPDKTVDLILAEFNA